MTDFDKRLLEIAEALEQQGFPANAWLEQIQQKQETEPKPPPEAERVLLPVVANPGSLTHLPDGMELYREHPAHPPGRMVRRCLHRREGANNRGRQCGYFAKKEYHFCRRHISGFAKTAKKGAHLLKSGNQTRAKRAARSLAHQQDLEQNRILKALGLAQPGAKGPQLGRKTGRIDPVAYQKNRAAKIRSSERKQLRDA